MYLACVFLGKLACDDRQIIALVDERRNDCVADFQFKGEGFAGGAVGFSFGLGLVVLGSM
jgi:hypothetical protein